MKIKTLIAAMALATLPAASYAMCAGKSHQAMSCAEGTMWDAASQTCIKQVTG